MTERIVVIVQARTGSTRLPVKALRPIKGKPMLWREIERLKAARSVDELIVATTDKKEDDAIEALAVEAGVKCFRGSELDVLDRYYQAARKFHADIVIRVTGDCPVHDPAVVDMVVAHFKSVSPSLDYTSTPTNYPEGFDTEVFSFKALERAWQEAKLPSEREHVTPYIRNHPELFVCDSWTSGVGEHSDLHLSVDTEQDFVFVSALYDRLYDEKRIFGMNDILNLLVRDPAIAMLRSGGTGYEGYEKSLKEDDEYKKHHV